MKKLALALAIAALSTAGAARAQLRNVDLAFQEPTDTRVVGFHVYLASSSQAYTDYRDDINYVPAPDPSGVAHYALNGIEEFQNVYVSLRSYDAYGVESSFSNEIVVPAEPQCLVSGCNDNNPCTVDTCTSTGCVYDPAPLVGSTCDDGNAMTYNDVCQAGGTCAGTVAQCNVDADCPPPKDVCAGPQACIAHTCQPGSSPLPDETACNDGNASTLYDVCRSGVCQGFACGSDAQCGDGNVCDGTETCVANSCVAGTPLACSTDQGPCFSAYCDATAGCSVQVYPDGTACTTSISGTAGTCSAGVCTTTSTATPTSTKPGKRKGQK